MNIKKLYFIYFLIGVNLPDTSLASDSILVPGSTLTSYKKGTDYVVLTTHTSYRTTSDIFSLQWNEFSMGSFSSGAISGLHVASGLLSPITSPHYTLDFIAPTVLQTGYYETQLTAHPSYLLNTIGCGSRDGYGYADFMNTQLGFTGGAVLGSAKQAIAYYGMNTLFFIFIIFHFRNSVCSIDY